MTDSPIPADPGPVDPDVELASAHLDGEAGADERARAQDAAVQAHLAAFRDVAGQVRDVPPPAPGMLDDHVAAAMAAFDPQGRVVPMASRRPEPWWQRIPLGAVAAALVAIALVGAIGLASRSGEDDSADTATGALESADEGAESGSAGGGTSEDFGAAADAMEEGPVLESDAGGVTRAYDSYEALADDLRQELAAAAPSAGGGASASAAPEAERGEGGDPCDAVDLLGLDPAAVVLVRNVLVTPSTVTAVVHDADDGRRLTVVDDASCTVAFDRVL